MCARNPCFLRRPAVDQVDLCDGCPGWEAGGVQGTAKVTDLDMDVQGLPRESLRVRGLDGSRRIFTDGEGRV